MKKKTGVEWDNVVYKIQKEPWAAELYRILKEDYEENTRIFPKQPPLEESAWGHFYFCSDCGIRLRFDALSPKEHVCPLCGKIYTGMPYDGSWVKGMHSSIISNMERAVILAHAEKERSQYLNYIHDTIMFYVNHYDKYPVHGQQAGKGKVFPQVLSESIFVIAIERLIRLCEPLPVFSGHELKAIGEYFFKPAAELIKPQVFKNIHNINVWMQGGIAACASFLKDREMLEEAIYGEYGWINQLEKGTSEEGIWYEVSGTYHFYTLNAFLSLAWIANDNDINLFAHPALQRMALNYLPLAYPNGMLPSYNDGWFGGNIAEICPLYEQLSYFDKSYNPLLEELYRNMEEEPYRQLNELFNRLNRTTGYARASLAALLYGPARLDNYESMERKSFVYKDIGMAVLQNDNLRVSLKFTKDGGGHDHKDKNSIEVYAGGELISYDVGTSGYGIAFTGEWCQSSLAHNMVCINYERQQRSDGELLYAEDNKVCAAANHAYEGVTLAREITLLEDGFKDVYEVKNSRPSQMDWMFRCKGTIESDLKLIDREQFSCGNGYNYLFNLKKADTSDGFHIKFITGNCDLHMDFQGEKDTEVVIGNCYGKDRADIQSFVMVRRYGMDTDFSQCTRIVK